MALERIGPLPRPPGALERQQPLPGPNTPQPGQAPAGDAADFPLAPSAPTTGGIGNVLLDGDDGRPSPAMAAALAAAAAELPEALDGAAMRPNQLFSRQLVWPAPDSNLMAASWQVMVRAYGEYRSAWLEQGNGRHMPASLFMTDQASAGLRDGRPATPLVTQMEPWRFSVYAWGAEQLVLKVVVRKDEEERSRRKKARVGLRLELMLPGIGRVIIQMEPAGAGVVLEISAGQASALQHMRELLPRLSATLADCGLSLVRCRLRRDLDPATDYTYPTKLQAASLPQPLFKAMAELAVLLSQPQPANDDYLVG
ncbi:flagellar hook-length control protein FliK [Oxalobacteraceae bacterium A2-2]